jgi:hypothetical protein
MLFLHIFLFDWVSTCEQLLKEDTGRRIAFSISAWAPPQKAKTTYNDQAQVERPARKGYDNMKQ